MKRIFFIVIALLIFAVAVFLSGEKEDGLAVAACPTFQYMLEGRDVRLVRTKSTSESLALLENGAVDMIISGRALREEEPKLLSEVIGDGYDLINTEEIILYEKDMPFVLFYTDLSKEEILRDFNHISKNNLIETKNLDRDGIIITRLEGSLSKEPVHVFKNDGSRVRLSRLPRIYYPPGTKIENVDFIKNIIKD